MGTDEKDVTIVIHDFDHVLSLLKIIKADPDYYLCTHFGWAIQLGNALRRKGGYEYDNY